LVVVLVLSDRMENAIIEAYVFAEREDVLGEQKE
jgi:hypothetical protein